MKATLEFQLPEDESQRRAAIAGMDLVCAVSEFDNILRQWVKHGYTPNAGEDGKPLTDPESVLHHALEQLHNILAEHGINLDALLQ